MLVTVMIPTYNQKEYVGNAIESALAQSYADLEIVVADDASPDPDVAKVLELYRNNPKVRLYRNAQNLGRVANYRKTLYERARGEWVINLDGDDYLVDPCFVEDAVGVVKKHPDIVAVLGGCEVLQASGTLKAQQANMRLSGRVAPRDVFSGVLDGTLFPYHNTTLYSRTHALTIGFYSQDIVSSDLESFLRLFARGAVGILPRIVGAWREHSGNTSGTMAFSDYLANILVFESVMQTAEEQDIAVKSSFLKSWSSRYAYSKGKDYAYRLLKDSDSPSLCFRYLKRLSNVSSVAALRILIQPKVLFNLLAKALPSHISRCVR